MSWVRVAWSKCTFLYVSYMLVQISFFISSTYIVFVFIDPKISTPMNQGRVPHNNLSFHRCIPPSYHNFIKWQSSTLDPILWPGQLRNFVTMVGPWYQRAPFWSEGTSSFSPLTFWWNKTQDSYRMDLILNRIPYKKTRMLRKNMCALIWSKKISMH